MQLSNRIIFCTLTLRANNAGARLQYDVIRERADKIIIRTELSTASLDSVTEGVQYLPVLSGSSSDRVEQKNKLYYFRHNHHYCSRYSSRSNVC